MNLFRARPDEEEVARAAIDRVLGRAYSAADENGAPLVEVLAESLYHEELRLARVEPSPRNDDDRVHCANIRRELATASVERQRQLLAERVQRYAEEIRGHFDPAVYAAATRVLPYGLGFILRRAPRAVALSPKHATEALDRHVLMEGETERLRKLAELGTIVLVPTHGSNLDSVLMGYAIYRIGLPPFVYGAGLNLFTNPVLGFFMNHLGAYTVDRSKSDPLYRDLLKEYATVALERGHHGLFFPGGTRSRSGALEQRLKLGLLGTAVTAFGNNLRADRDKSRVFIVPCTVSYPLVLEARSLVSDYLRSAGKGRYVTRGDESERARTWFEFVTDMARVEQRIHLVFGKPLDPMGNEVDDEGVSHDMRGRPVDAARYLMVDGRVTIDAARDAEYTHVLAARVLETFRRDNVALPTHVLAFVLTEGLRERSRQRDLFRFLRGLGDRATLPMSWVRERVSVAMQQIRAMADRGVLRASTTTRTDDLDGLLSHAFATLRAYRAQPIAEPRGDELVINDPSLLFFYRNRLEGYGLLDARPMLPSERGGAS